MSSLSVEPAYGRDYKSKKAILKALNAEKDFLGTHPGMGMLGVLFNTPQLLEEGLTQIDRLNVRYQSNTKQAILTVVRKDGKVSIK